VTNYPFNFGTHDSINNYNSTCEITILPKLRVPFYQQAKKYDHISPLLKELIWLPVEKLIYLRSATLAFECMTCSAPDYLTSKFTRRFNISGRETKNSQALHIPLFKLASG